MRPPDFWVPVVFSRIGNGRIWYQPGFAQGQSEGFDGWNALLQTIKQGKCTPVLGSGLLEGLVGSPREIARRGAEDVNFAKSPHDREDLPQVTQYLSVMESGVYPSEALEERLRTEVARRFHDLPVGASLDALLSTPAIVGVRPILPSRTRSWPRCRSPSLLPRTPMTSFAGRLSRAASNRRSSCYAGTAGRTTTGPPRLSTTRRTMCLPRVVHWSSISTGGSAILKPWS